MNTGLLEQLAEYGAYHDEVQGSIEATDIVEGVHTSLAPKETVVRRPRSIPVGLLTAAAAAMAVLLVVGGAVFLRWSVDDVDDPTVTQPVTETTVQDTTETTIGEESEPVVPPTEPRVLGPGSWSVAATVDSASVDLSAVANEVASWDGVFEVGIATDQETWHDLTGFATCPVDGSPACAEGLVVLVAEPWINEVSLRLQSEYDAATVTANELAVEYWQTYADAVTSRDAPDLSFDATSLGIEIPLRRAVQLDDLAWLASMGSISMVVEVDVDGTEVQAAAHTVAEYPDVVAVSGTWGGSTSWPGRNGTYLDASDQSVIMADLTGFTDLDDPIGPRRLYYLAGLPLDATVVATRLADGTPVWQRPVDGMVLIVDEPGSLPDRFAPFYDQDGLPDLEDMAPAHPFVVYDAAGNEIVRIEENVESFGARALIVTDLRVPPIATGSGISQSPRSSSVATVIGSLEERFGRSSFAEDRIVATDDALWVGSLDLDGSSPTGALYRIDPATSAITDRIRMDGGVADMLVDRDVLWVLTGAGDLRRMDPSSGEITATVKIDCDVDDCSWSRNDLMIAGGAVWLINPQGQWRIDPTTLQAEVVPDKGGVGHDLNAGGSADGIEVDEFGGTGGAMWLGEADGLLWSLGSHDGNLQGLDPQTNRRFGYEMHTLAGVDATESRAILAGGDIWLVPSGSPRVVRFDTATREISTVPFSGGWYATVADGALWIAGQDHVDRIDLEAGILSDSLVIEGLAPDSVIADGLGAIWVSGEGVVIRIDASARQVADVIEIESGGQLLAVDGVIWVAGQDGTVLRIDAG